jgi:hypothetical protein
VAFSGFGGRGLRQKDCGGKNEVKAFHVPLSSASNDPPVGVR